MHVFLLGLLLFLFGLEGSKKGLDLLSSKHLQKTFLYVEDNVYIGILIGALITGILQSSSAVTVILIGLLDAEMISLRSALSILLGANIGTTITIQIISLPVLQLYPWLIFLGVLLYISGWYFNSYNVKGMGITIFSFGIVFTGLNMMTGFFDNPLYRNIISNILSYGQNTIPGIFMGFFITAVVQSSSIVTGLTVSLARGGLISLPVAISITLGSNIGTCITGFIASLTCGKTAKVLAWGNFLFNMVGVLFILPFLQYFIKVITITTGTLPRQIANAHTFFNLLNVILFIPFYDTFVSFLRRNINGDY